MPPGTDLLQKERGSKARKKVRAARSALQRQSRKGTLLERSAHAKLRPALVPRRNRNSRKDTRSASGEREAGGKNSRFYCGKQASGQRGGRRGAVPLPTQSSQQFAESQPGCGANPPAACAAAELMLKDASERKARRAWRSPSATGHRRTSLVAPGRFILFRENKRQQT